MKKYALTLALLLASVNTTNAGGFWCRIGCTADWVSAQTSCGAANLINIGSSARGILDGSDVGDRLADAGDFRQDCMDDAEARARECGARCEWNEPWQAPYWDLPTNWTIGYMWNFSQQYNPGEWGDGDIISAP